MSRQLVTFYDAAMWTDLAALVDLDAYPIDQLEQPRTVALAHECRAALDATGVAIVPDFVRPDALAAMVSEAEHSAPDAHHQDIVATPYLELPTPEWPPNHPRLAQGRSALTAIPYDDFAPNSPLRALYESDALLTFIARALGNAELFRYNDPLGALNVASMTDGDELYWHFDQTDFVVSIALQSSDKGGHFECVPEARAENDERYADVAAVLAGERRERVTTVPMAPGTLMFFEGRASLHRVTPIEGPTARYVALLGYDTRRGTCSSEILRLVRYGRGEARRD